MSLDEKDTDYGPNPEEYAASGSQTWVDQHEKMPRSRGFLALVTTWTPFSTIAPLSFCSQTNLQAVLLALFFCFCTGNHGWRI